MKIRRALALAAAGLALLAPACGRDEVVTPQPPCLPDIGPAGTIQALEVAIRNRDYGGFQALFDSGFVFVTTDSASAPSEIVRRDWLRIWRRVMGRENPLPCPVPAAMWLQSILVSFNPRGDFQERKDLYRDPVRNPNGLDPQRWYAAEATYSASFIFDLAGGTDFQVDGKAVFVVLVDRQAMDPCGRHLTRIHRWEEPGGGLGKVLRYILAETRSCLQNANPPLVREEERQRSSTQAPVGGAPGLGPDR